jgi:hypothetical protein
VVPYISNNRPAKLGEIWVFENLKKIKKRPWPTCQCQTPFNRPPGRWPRARAPAARPRVGGPSFTTVGHVCHPAHPYPLRAWAPKQRPTSSLPAPLSARLASALPLTSSFLLPLCSSSRTEHRHYEPLFHEGPTDVPFATR